jgi:hypothetical protein
MLIDQIDGILNYCRTKVPLGVVEAVIGNIKSLLRRGRGYKNLPREIMLLSHSCAEPQKMGLRLWASLNDPEPQNVVSHLHPRLPLSAFTAARASLSRLT